MITFSNYLFLFFQPAVKNQEIQKGFEKLGFKY